MGRTKRITVVVALVAAMVTPELVTPVRAVTRPATLSARHSFDTEARSGSLRLALPATHGMFSWSGKEGSGVRFRYMDDGEPTAWVEAPESHDLEHGSRHYSAPLLLDRSWEVEWEAFGGARGVVLDYVNTIDGPRRSIEIPATASAAGAEPDVITRAEWGADESLGSRSGDCTRTFYKPQQVFVHHTVTTNSDPNPDATVRAIQYFHTEGRGWCDIGYNFLVSQDGRVYEGRWARSYQPWETHDGEDLQNRIVTGAHAADFNSGSIGVSVLGNYQTGALSRSARRTLVAFLAWEFDKHNLNPKGWHRYKNPADGETRYLPYLAGHRDAGTTGCPGQNLYKLLPKIRRAVAERIGNGKVLSDLVPAPPKPAVYGSDAPQRFHLTKSNGEPIPERRITFYVRTDGRWKFAGRDDTNSNGWSSLALMLDENSRVAASWPGDERRWGDEARRRQAIRPSVTIVPNGLETTPGVYTYDPGTTEIYVSGDVAPAHPYQFVNVHLWQQQVEGGPFVELEGRQKRLNGASHYVAKLTMPGPGTYQVQTTIDAHDDHARGLSPKVIVEIPATPVP